MQVPPTCVDHLGDPTIDGSVDPDGSPVACENNPDCPADRPVCDPDARECRGCSADAECASDVCHELTGACVDETAAVYVAATGADNASCSRTNPCATFAAGVNALTATRTTIKVADGNYTGGFLLRRTPPLQTATILISGSHTGWDGAVLTAMGQVSVENIEAVIEGITIQGANQDGIQNKGTTTLSRVLITGGAEDGIDGRGNKLTVLDSRIENNTLVGIDCLGSDLEVQRSQIVSNKQGGILVQNGAFTIVNNVIAKNGSALTGMFGGAKLAPSSGGAAVFRFNTVANNLIGSTVAGVTCDTPVTVEDSILSNSTIIPNELAGACTPKYCLFGANAPNGNGNLMGAPMFVNAPTDYHLLPGSPAIDKADPAATETTDFEGAHRPTGAARDIGADEQP